MQKNVNCNRIIHTLLFERYYSMVERELDESGKCGRGEGGNPLYVANLLVIWEGWTSQVFFCFSFKNKRGRLNNRDKILRFLN